jgi:iron complex transport system ATP-binding protein
VSDIAVRGVSVTIEGASILRAVDLFASSGAWVGLVGPNGAGKTTLLRAVARLVEHEGSIELDGRELDGDRRSIARLIAYVTQTPLIPPAIRVADYVLMGRTAYIPYFGVESAEDLHIAAEVLEQLDLADLADRMLGSLSGGELQRAVLGRALAQHAPILLLDEPTAALDVGHQQQVLELVDRLRGERGLTVISTMHDLSLAGQFAGSLVLLDEGRVVATGTAPEVLTEELIRVHFGAAVRVLVEDGNVVVIPRRERAPARALVT